MAAIDVRKLFIIHGHDSLAMYELKDFVHRLGLRPIVLSLEDDAGLTIIEKFETYAEPCCFAIALLTPDDKQAHDLARGELFRARQNVILEIGWFMHKVRRRNVVLVHKGSVEIPSDLSGILYLQYTNSVMEVAERLRSRLSKVGLI